MRRTGGRGEREAPAGEQPPPRHRYAALDDRELVAAMRRDEEPAFAEFVSRFHPLLLRQAHILRIPSEERDEMITTILDDVAERVTSPGARIPASLGAYLAATLRNRVVNAHRDRKLREQRYADAIAPPETHHERAVLSLCSEAAVRASEGMMWEPEPLDPALPRMAAALDRGLTADERLLVTWIGARIPQREIADWLGVSAVIVAKRITRLRARLCADAARYVAAQEPRERRALHRFFRRIARGEHR